MVLTMFSPPTEYLLNAFGYLQLFLDFLAPTDNFMYHTTIISISSSSLFMYIVHSLYLPIGMTPFPPTLLP